MLSFTKLFKYNLVNQKTEKLQDLYTHKKTTNYWKPQLRIEKEWVFSMKVFQCTLLPISVYTTLSIS